MVFFALESLRKAIIAADKAVASMVGCLNFQDSLVQASTAQALGMLACDQSVRQQVAMSKANNVKKWWDYYRCA